MNIETWVRGDGDGDEKLREREIGMGLPHFLITDYSLQQTGHYIYKIFLCIGMMTCPSPQMSGEIKLYAIVPKSWIDWFLLDM